jgi:hypothetical protein
MRYSRVEIFEHLKKHSSFTYLSTPPYEKLSVVVGLYSVLMGFMSYNHIENDEAFQLKNLMGSMKLCHTTQLKMMKPFSSRIFPQLLKGLCFRRNSKSKRIVGLVSFHIFNLSVTSFACEEVRISRAKDCRICLFFCSFVLTLQVKNEKWRAMLQNGIWELLLWQLRDELGKNTPKHTFTKKIQCSQDVCQTLLVHSRTQ